MSIRLKRPDIRIPQSVIKLAAIAYVPLAALLHEQMEDPTSPTSIALTKTGESIDNFTIGNFPAGHIFGTDIINLFNDMVFQTVGLNLPRAELINFLDLLIVGLPFFAVAGIGIGRLFKPRINIEMLAGTEKVKGNPSHVIFAPNIERLEDIVNAGSETGKLRNKKGSEVVGFHEGQGAPLSLLPIGQNGQLGHHFLTELKEVDGELKISQSLIEESGLDKAREITFYCLPDLYSNGKDLAISPYNIESVLNNINLKGKIINIIIPDITGESYLQSNVSIINQGSIKVL